MAIEIKVPRLGWNMEQGTFMGWLMQEGDTVQAGAPLFILEGDKAVQEIEATDGGILRCLPNGPEEGETVRVGAVLGFLTAKGESLPSASGSLAAGVSGRRYAFAQRQAITPRARSAAKRLGVDWTKIAGTGRNGRIRERDIPGLVAPRLGDPPEERLDTTRTRQAIAGRMLHSLRNTAPVTLTTSVDATNLVNLRSRLRDAGTASSAVVPSVTDLFVKLAASSLRDHPLLNSRWQDDRIVTSAEIHIGIAVDTEAGLLVPVIRDVGKLSLEQVALCSRELIEHARSGRLRAEDMRGGTFTITNLGPFGIDAFTPIIHWPECAILGLGRIHKQPAVVDNQVVPRDLVTLSLTFDHRLVDGAPAARFLQAVCRVVEYPESWLKESGSTVARFGH